MHYLESAGVGVGGGEGRRGEGKWSLGLDPYLLLALIPGGYARAVPALGGGSC